jgi:AraC-like DNA-binding protein
VVLVLPARASEEDGTPALPLSVPWSAHPEPVDGRLGPWKGIRATRFLVGGTPVAVRVAWDEGTLRVLCEVGDATPVTAGIRDEDPALGSLSDSIEIFLDVQGERTRFMDTNDYQFTVARDGRRTTFKGSAALAETIPKPLPGVPTVQPKDWGMNIPLEVAVSDGPEAGPDGSAGYRIEVAIPWTAVGGAPPVGREFDLDVAVNDLSHPPGADAPPVVRSADWSSRVRFESPAAWSRARLAPPGIWPRVLRRAGPWFAGLGVALVLALAFLLGRRAVLRKKVAALAVAPLVVGDATPSTNDDPVERLRRSLGPRLREDLTAESLADLAGVSLRTLQRLFRERFGTSPMNWLMETRLQEAARLIRTGDDPVTKIAYRVGFKDPSHFTRRFKARFGISPNEFRRSETGPGRGVDEAGEGS